ELRADMERRSTYTLYLVLAAALIALAKSSPSAAQSLGTPTIALKNGRWFNGASFVARTVTYSVDGRFTFETPARVDTTIDLGDSWVIPPFAEAHNHNLGSGVEEWDRRTVAMYLADGVFYVKIQGNLPLSDSAKGRLGINRADGLDVAFANGSLTSTNGHPTALTTGLLTRGWFPGHTPETLRDLRYFTIDSAADLERKWPLILGQRSDFTKTMLLFSEEFNKRRKDRTETVKGLDPQLLPLIVAKAHAAGLRVSTHVNTSTDFHYAVMAGADEIVHLPPLRGSNPRLHAETPLAVEDVKSAAERGIIVVTTASLALNAAEETHARSRELQRASLELLHAAGVTLAIGSDSPTDTSVGEAMYVSSLGVFDNVTLLNIWVETAKAVFPHRRIGALREGYEASFLALQGDPLLDLENVRRIKLRFKQGLPLTIPKP
ncbi:MAG: amidohydrolase family protein, partial [Gemmatimonadota bacterium]